LLVELDLDSFRGRGAQVFNHHCGPVACRAGILPAGAGHGGLVAADTGLEGRPTMGGTRVGPASLAEARKLPPAPGTWRTVET
jgi:hypothetical protein